MPARQYRAEGGMGGETLGGSISKILWIMLKESSDIVQQTPLKLMMRNKKLFYGIIALVLVASAIFIWNNYQIQIRERPDKPIKFPPQLSKKCGIENCHGLDITCGPNVPEACDMMYMAGDNCRQFASCQKIDGQCVLKMEPKFESCKFCVEKCGKDFANDSIKFFECESKCANEGVIENL